MFGAAVRSEINSVAVPHRKTVGPIGVGNVFAGIVFQVVNGDRLCQTAGVPLPSAEVAKDDVVSELRTVRGIREQAALVHWKRLR